MKNRNINNISLPLNLILKINIVRMLIIWDTIAKYIYRILLLLLLFSILTLTEVFSHLIIDRYQNTNDNVLNKKVEFIKNKLKKIDVTFEF